MNFCKNGLLGLKVIYVPRLRILEGHVSTQRALQGFVDEGVAGGNIKEKNIRLEVF